MCKRCTRSSQCENITGMQNFLDHSEGVSKVTPQICRSSGLGGQKILHHHKSMQVWEPPSLAWCMLYMAGYLDKTYVYGSGLFCLGFFFCVLLFEYTERTGVLERTGHGCTTCSLVRCRWSPFLVTGYSMEMDCPCCCQGLQGEARQPSKVFRPRPLSQPSGNPQIGSCLFFQTSIKTLNLINNSGEKEFYNTSLRGKSCLELHGPDFGQPNSTLILVLMVSCG